MLTSKVHARVNHDATTISTTMHAQESVLRVSHGNGWSFFYHGVSLQKDIFQIQETFLPNLRHVREETEDDIFKTEDAQGALLVIEWNLSGLESDLIQGFQVLLNI